MSEFRIEGGNALVGGNLVETCIHVEAKTGTIAGIGHGNGVPRTLNANGLTVLPGIVDIHGDAFERQMMPRPGVDFPIDVALADTDRQVIANGITTVFHGVTWSWEPGLRGPKNARSMLDAIERMQSSLAADTRYHLRHETYNLDAEAEISGWLTGKRIGLLAFNDHMTSIVKAKDRAHKIASMIPRSGLSSTEFEELVERTVRRGNEVPASVSRLAEIAVANGIPILSHDDASPEQRRWYRSLGCKLSEFPVNVETAEEAARESDDIIFGAPNVVRGGSHTGWTKASDMVARGLCSVLASDYYYPAPLLAAFRLAAEDILPFDKAWALVSESPARAAGLTDRGRIAEGQRADLILVDAVAERPRVVATIAAGRIVHLTDADRLIAA